MPGKEVWECLGISEFEYEMLQQAVYDFGKEDRERVERINQKYKPKPPTPEHIEKEKREYKLWVIKKAKENKTKKR